MQILEDFNNIFGHELKEVSGDPKRIDEMRCRVETLVLPIEKFGMDVFDINKRGSWKTIMQDFDAVVQVCSGHLFIVSD